MSLVNHETEMETFMAVNSSTILDTQAQPETGIVAIMSNNGIEN